MIRYMIAPIIGTGTDENPYRPEMPDVVNKNPRIPTLPNGAPKYRFAFCVVATPSIAAIEQVSNAYVFPDYPLDGLLSGMESGVRAAMVQSVQAYNLDNNGYYLVVPNEDTNSFRDVITSIGLQFDPSFVLSFFGVSEVSE